MATIEAFDAYIKNLKLDDNPELRDIIKIHRKILLELPTEDEQARYFENFLKEINLFYKNSLHKK